MIQTITSSTAETAFHKLWENLRVIEDELSDEGRQAIARHSDTQIPLTETVIETSKRIFYSIWEKLDPESYLAAKWVEDEFWSGRELPHQLPRLWPREWHAISKSIAKELPSNELLEHWQHRLLLLGFGTVMSEPGYLSFAVKVEWRLAQESLNQLRCLAELSRKTDIRLANVDPLEDVHPNDRYVFRCTPEMIVIRYYDKQHSFCFRRQPRGFIYLYKLLQNPDKDLTLYDILGSPTEDREERYTKYESLWIRSYNDDDEETKAFGPREGFGVQTLVDMKTLENVHKRMEELRNEYEKAKQQVDDAAQRRITRELDELNKYIKDVEMPGSGRLRTFRDKQLRAIRRDLLRAYEKLEENGMSSLANHFRRYVEVNGREMVYRPPDGLKWHF